MKRKLYVSGVVMTVLFGIVGCMLFDRESPTTPTLPANPEQLVNCYAVEGEPAGYGVYMGAGYFVANVPQGGSYAILYKTKYGVFDVVFKVKKASMMFIGLQPDDVVDGAMVLPTTVTLDDVDGETIGDNLLVFSRPGKSKKLHLITLLPDPASVDFFAPTLIVQNVKIPRVFIIKGGKVHVKKDGEDGDDDDDDDNGGLVVVELKYEVIYRIIVATRPATSL